MKAVLQRDELEVRLRPLKYADRELVEKWLSDPYILKLTFVVSNPDGAQSLPFSKASLDHCLDLLIADKSRMTLAIMVNEHHVGNLGLKEYHPGGKSGELFIEIGESEYRGVGIGKVSIAILLDYVFFTLGLDEMKLEVLEFNSVAMHVYEQLGFSKTNQTGFHYDENKRAWQVWGMKLLKERWRLCRCQLSIPTQVVVTPLTEF